VTVILFFISAVSDFCSALIASRAAGIVLKLSNLEFFYFYYALMIFSQSRTSSVR
jgi:hypothetical protein